MSAECCFTDVPEYILKKEYDGKPDIDSLHELFVIIYKVDNIDKDLKKSSRYVFIKSIERAMKQWKLFGPRGALLHRIFTDDEDINKLALDNENKNTIIETDSLETIIIPEVQVENDNTLDV